MKDNPSTEDQGAQTLNLGMPHVPEKSEGLLTGTEGLLWERLAQCLYPGTDNLRFFCITVFL